MDLDELRPWLTTWRLPGIGPVAFQTILEAFGEPAAYLAATPPEGRRRGLDEKIAEAVAGQQAVQAGVDQDLAWLEAADDRHILTLADPAYPAQLRHIADPPAVLFVRGRLEALGEPQLAMVGTRNASQSGSDTAADFARHLATTGLVITSGLALGIDAVAHRGALDAGGQTIAVMGTGPERLYPRDNHGLAHAIAEQGAVITEMPTGTPMDRGLFPRRNRLISGLSVGVLVVEAGAQSGALQTSQRAVEQNREVFAIPGSIHSPLARGCNQLIQNGAKLVTAAQDVVDELRHVQGVDLQKTAAPDALAIDASAAGGGDWIDEDPAYGALLDAMGYDPIGFDTLAERVGLTPDILSSMLLSLEMYGYVESSHGGRYTRIRHRAGG